MLSFGRFWCFFYTEIVRVSLPIRFFFLDIFNETWILTWIRDLISLINKAFKSGSRHRDWCMLRYLNYLIGYFSSYFTLYTPSQWFSCTCCTPRSALGLWWFTNFYYTLFLEMVFKNTSYNKCLYYYPNTYANIINIETDAQYRQYTNILFLKLFYEKKKPHSLSL